MPELPTGTVTFLFTDIEGSARLWEQHGDVMAQALARHDAILRQAIASHGGHVFKTVGDAVCAAFADAAEAVAAALAAQRALRDEAWHEGAELRVRTALHSGAAQEREGDYLGPALNRVARLRSAAHGGQTLLSRATYELVRERLPEGVSLQDLGEHRLRDLSHAEHVFQLLHADLPADFPPLRSLQAFTHNLPLQLTTFIGREREIKEVQQLLADTRLLTLTGVGGAGKTRLALQVAAEVLEEYRDGVWLTELAPLADPELVPQTVASAVGVREQPGRSIVETLTDHLRSKTCLVILDNCEHLLDACARLADALLRSCPDLKVLASSREGLSIAGEMSYRVKSLSLPAEKAAVTADSIALSESVRLFADRAQSHQPSFEITDSNAPAVARICQRLDGIPLALELAAARVRTMPAEQIAERLDDRFGLLTGGSRAALPRQRTLEAAIDWSYDALAEEERLLCRRLAVFAGGWTLEAAEAVCAGGGIEERDVLESLVSLVERSMVEYQEQQGEARYRLLETVGQYAQDRLQESGEDAAVRKRHWEYFLAFAERAASYMGGPDQGEWLDRLEGDLGNLRTALDWCEEALESAELGLRLPQALFLFWVCRGYLNEGRLRFAAALSREGAAHTTARAHALGAAGYLALVQDDYRTARALTEEAFGIYTELGDDRGACGLLPALGCIALRQGDRTAARAYFDQGLSMARRLGPAHEAHALYYTGTLAEQAGDYAAACAYYEQAAALDRACGQKGGMALPALGRVTVIQGDQAKALALLTESLTNASQVRDKPVVLACIEGLGLVAQAQEQAARAARLFGAAEALREAMGAPLAPGERNQYDRSVAAALGDLGQEPFETAWADGRAMTMDDAIEYALEGATDE